MVIYYIFEMREGRNKKYMDGYNNSNVFINGNSFDSHSVDSVGTVSYYTTSNYGEENKKKETPLSEEDEKRLREESIDGKITGKPSFGSFIKLSYIHKEDMDLPYYTKALSDIKFLDNEVVEFDLGGCDPYDQRKLFRKRTITFSPNELTCLIGCNGSGKSTIINTIKDIIKDNGYAVIHYNNMVDGGTNIVAENGGMDAMLSIFSIKELSEGEQILNASSRYLELLGNILKGNVKRDTGYHLFRDQQHVFLLLDAIDSGYSIDNIYNLVYQLYSGIKLAKDNDKYLYIIVAANSYELVRGNKCWDVQLSKEVTFKDYEEYRDRIIATRQHILKQWEKEEEKKNDS